MEEWGLPLKFFNAKAFESDKMTMMQPSKKLYFSAELILSLLGNFVHPLHSYHWTITKLSFENGSKSPLSNYCVEVICCLLCLLISEFPKYWCCACMGFVFPIPKRRKGRKGKRTKTWKRGKEPKTKRDTLTVCFSRKNILQNIF